MSRAKWLFVSGATLIALAAGIGAQSLPVFLGLFGATLILLAITSITF